MGTSGWESGPVPERRIAILTAGGPAPGLNGVIHGVTVAAAQRGWKVIGIPKGFSHLMAGPEAAARVARPLLSGDVAGIEARGGSILFTSRANPSKSPDAMAKVAASLERLKVTDLVTVGGDDTATTASLVGPAAKIRVAHVPKTIDNDLPLPGDVPTFGFETAKELGATLCRNLRVDALTTGRWYIVTAMGRSAGHLALGMALASGADLAVIPEEFPAGALRLAQLSRLVQKAILVRGKGGQEGGLVVLAEGLLDRLDPGELAAAVGQLERDEHGNPRMSEVDLGKMVRDLVGPALKAAGTEVGFITKIVGYELRCADPVSFDVQYSVSLGAAAVEFLATGSGDALIALEGGRAVPLRFPDLRDPATGKVRVRRVDLLGAAWKAALATQAREA
ncbi:MAG: 6-phosphofructokinase [Thermoplasmatota archaeon]